MLAFTLRRAIQAIGVLIAARFAQDASIVHLHFTDPMRLVV